MARPIPTKILPLLLAAGLLGCEMADDFEEEVCGSERPRPSREYERGKEAGEAACVEELYGFAFEVDQAQMRACWDRKGRRATPARRDELKELVNDYCVKDWGGCDEQGQIQTDGCWGEATVRVHGEAARLVCAFYDRPVTEECGPLSTGICEPGWELVDCHEKGRSASEGSERKGLFKKLRKR